MDENHLVEIATLADAEKLEAIVATVLPLSGATRGRELREPGRGRRKIMLRVVQCAGAVPGLSYLKISSGDET